MHWFSHDAGPANETEILLFTCLVVEHAPRVTELNIWAKEVLAQEQTFYTGGTLPPAWHAKSRNTVAPIFNCIYEDKRRGGSNQTLEKIAGAITQFTGPAL